jgi:RNA polymerase sigma-54 factor
MTLAPQMRQGLKLLAMSLPELRGELLREMSANPVIEDIEPTLEKTTVSEKERESAESDRVNDYPDDDYGFEDAYIEGVNRGRMDEEAVERRERLFANQIREETLEEHLLAQLPLSDVAPEDVPLAELLIGELDDNGYFRGSIPDLMMISGESEAKIRAVLSAVMKLDPPGCGAMSARECLMAQLDKLDGSPERFLVEELIDRHLENAAAGKIAEIGRDLGIDRGRYVKVLKALRTLDPHPGRAYRATRRPDEYVNPEIHAVRCDDGWRAEVDARSLPEIRISPKYLKMLSDPNMAEADKDYIRERIRAARALAEAVEKRRETVADIAQAIFDAQAGFFEGGLKALKPLTMQEIADKVGVHLATVSRTVRDKYAETPKGTVELRRFFVGGVTGEDGVQVSKDSVLDRIRSIISEEDSANPLSDEKIVEKLKSEGFSVARRTIAKYRAKLGIGGVNERRK